MSVTITANYPTLYDAITAIGSNKSTLVIDQTLSVPSDTTVPANITLSFTGDGILNISSGSTVSINGPLHAPFTRVFSDTGTVILGKGYIREASPSWWGAVGDDTADDTNALNRALNCGAHLVVLNEGTFRITSTITIPNNVSLHGSDRNASRIRIAGAIDGIRVGRNSTVSDLRIIGNSSMQNTNACLLLGAPGGGDSARSSLTHLIIGGESTGIGDPSNILTPALGIRGGITFLNKLDNLYVFNCHIGYDNIIGTGSGTNNSLEFSSCEFHSCKIGTRIARTNAVHFDTCTWENNSEAGLVIGESRAGSINNCYFEANNNNRGASPITGISADLLVKPGEVGGSDPASALSIQNCYFIRSASDYGIYMDGQRNCSITNNFLASYAGGISPIHITNHIYNSGEVLRNYTQDAAIQNNRPGVVRSNDAGGTVTLTLTGTSDTPAPTGTATYNRRDDIVFLSIPSILGTSNSTAAQLTGLPWSMKPDSDRFILARITNNGSTNLGMVRVRGNNGTIDIYPDLAGSSFTASGSKGIPDVTLSYHLH